MAQLSLGVKGRKKRGLNIASIPNCELWIDVARTETHTYANVTNLSQIADLSGKNRHLTKTGAGDETVYPTYSTTERGAVFLNNAYDQMIAGTNSDWNFLHNGDGCSILMLVKVDTAQPASNGVLLSSSSEASGGVGINLWYYNTNQNYYFSMRNGPGLVFANNGANNSLPKNSSTIISIHSGLRTSLPADLITRYNGATDLKVNNATSFSTANSTGPLYFGKLAVGVAKCRFVLKKCALFSRRLSKAEENLILEDWARSENIAITRYGEVPLAVVAGQSNAKGRGLISDTEFNATPAVTDASIFVNSSYSWSGLQAGTTNDAYSASTLGLEMTLAKQMVALTGKPFYLVKYAADGTPMTSWVSSNNNFINLQTAMRNAVWHLEDSGYVPKPFLIWYQGESDAIDSTLAAAYQANLQDFITQITATYGYAQCPTYLVQTNQTPPGIGYDVVRNAQLLTSMTVPFSAYVRHVETDDIADHIDQHHMKASTLNALGNRIARRHLKIAE